MATHSINPGLPQGTFTLPGHPASPESLLAHSVHQGLPRADQDPSFAEEGVNQGHDAAAVSAALHGRGIADEGAHNPSVARANDSRVSGPGPNHAHAAVCRPAASDVACQQVLWQLTQVPSRSKAVAGRDADGDQGEVQPLSHLPLVGRSGRTTEEGGKTGRGTHTMLCKGAVK